MKSLTISHEVGLHTWQPPSPWKNHLPALRTHNRLMCLTVRRATAAIAKPRSRSNSFAFRIAFSLCQRAFFTSARPAPVKHSAELLDIFNRCSHFFCFPSNIIKILWALMRIINFTIIINNIIISTHQRPLSFFNYSQQLVPRSPAFGASSA